MYQQTHQPMRMKSVNDIFVRNLKLPAIPVPAGIAGLGTDIPKVTEQYLLTLRVSRFVYSQSNCLATNRLMCLKDNSFQVQCYPYCCSPLRARVFDIMAGTHWYDSLYPSTKQKKNNNKIKPAIGPPGKTLCVRPI